MIPFAPTQEGDKELIELAFSKKKADDRKEWLRGFVVSFVHNEHELLIVTPFSARNLP
jgi:hypothetical protein